MIWKKILSDFSQKILGDFSQKILSDFPQKILNDFFQKIFAPRQVITIQKKISKDRTSSTYAQTAKIQPCVLMLSSITKSYTCLHSPL